MLQKKSVQVACALLLFLAGLVAGTAVYAGGAGSGPGSEMDPLAARSYLQQQIYTGERDMQLEIERLQARIKELQAEIKMLESAL